MREQGRVKRLPVVDEAGRLVGVISRADLLRVFRVSLIGTVERESLIAVALRLCCGVDGVVDVSDVLGFRVDDTSGPTTDTTSRRRSQLALDGPGGEVPVECRQAPSRPRRRRAAFPPRALNACDGRCAPTPPGKYMFDDVDEIVRTAYYGGGGADREPEVRMAPTGLPPDGAERPWRSVADPRSTGQPARCGPTPAPYDVTGPLPVKATV